MLNIFFIKNLPLRARGILGLPHFERDQIHTTSRISLDFLYVSLIECYGNGLKLCILARIPNAPSHEPLPRNSALTVLISTMGKA